MKLTCLLFMAVVAASIPGFSQTCSGLHENLIYCSATNCSENIEVLFCSPPNQSEHQCLPCQIYADCCGSKICDAEYSGACGDALVRSMKHVELLAQLGIPLYVPARDGGYVQLPQKAAQ
ncbi:MAG TPA: hypothetical protein VMI06_02135 [Terriglobia bacterium]|nr:hypothetical protein [Terriglobia bacterium]